MLDKVILYHHPTDKSYVYTAWKRTKIKILIDRQRAEEVDEFKYLGSVVTSDGYCEKDICSRIAMGKKAFMDKRKLFSSSLNLNLRNRIIKCFVFVWHFMQQRLGLSDKSRQETVRSLRSLDLEKNAKDQLDGQSNKFVCSRKSGGRKKHVQWRRSEFESGGHLSSPARSAGKFFLPCPPPPLF